jgi:hypothetical protein
MHNVISSATKEAKFGAPFFNRKDGTMLCMTLHDMDHPQSATPIKTNNSCATGIANDSICQRCSKAIAMHLSWIKDRAEQGQCLVYWRPGRENHADYFTKPFPASHHCLMKSRYSTYTIPPDQHTA